MKNNKGFSQIVLLTIILGVALLGVVGYIFYQNMTSNSSDDKTNLAPAISDKQVSFTDSTNGFSFKFPSNFTFYNDRDNPEWSSQKKEHFVVKVIKITENGKSASIIPGLDRTNLNNDIIKAIEKLDTLKIEGFQTNTVTKKIGNTNFLRIFPGPSEGCLCDTLTYVTIVKDNYIVFESHIDLSVRGKTDTEFQSEYKTNQDGLIKEMYGDIESVLATFNKI